MKLRLSVPAGCIMMVHIFPARYPEWRSWQHYDEQRQRFLRWRILQRSVLVCYRRRRLALPCNPFSEGVPATSCSGNTYFITTQSGQHIAARRRLMVAQSGGSV
ncbi:hypothetical protein HRR83_002824 [Exophiala dermatitidis]|uniref:Uncharacterized protein n=1 Tax=Exophiala dermatitidis TaxID=5970 RepID=A0AAN6EXS6_EXODE|nr:hypothetical protein HRR74_003744 [Exophiala dermatitidis]KAJ4521885.1 hypothetical protein HRR73_003084 [Exophiala dermatitidis]KAJ4537610.1 hypothetical protein HRR76_005601 [Exophiala dermatitidis]KAJ4551726.1 hypothetical protein HRR77_002957 [Exophiala dermatitidis]KAJ4569460.1 hypothetical protein HRR79_004311 [Exophiala dermatitidis]